MFQLGQFQQPLDEHVQAVGLVADLLGKQVPVGGGQLFLQQLGRTTDGGQRALEFVRHGAHQLLDMFVAIESIAHGLHGLGQVAQLTGQFRRRLALTQLHMLRVVAQAAHRPHDPAGDGHANGQ